MITVYAASAFVILELMSIVIDPLRLPTWTLPLVIVLLVIGFVIAVILSWIYDVSPEGGWEKTRSMTQKEKGSLPAESRNWKIASYFSFVVIAGLLLWFAVGKPASIYSRDWMFHIKLTLFVILGLLSIYPTIFFLKNRKGDDPDENIAVPKSVILLLRLELAVIIIMPVVASFVAWSSIGKF